MAILLVGVLCHDFLANIYAHLQPFIASLAYPRVATFHCFFSPVCANCYEYDRSHEASEPSAIFMTLDYPDVSEFSAQLF